MKIIKYNQITYWLRCFYLGGTSGFVLSLSLWTCNSQLVLPYTRFLNNGYKSFMLPLQDYWKCLYFFIPKVLMGIPQSVTFFPLQDICSKKNKQIYSDFLFVRIREYNTFMNFLHSFTLNSLKLISYFLVKQVRCILLFFYLYYITFFIHKNRFKSAKYALRRLGNGSLDFLYCWWIKL